MNSLTNTEIQNRKNITGNLLKNIDQIDNLENITDKIKDSNEILLLGECTHGTYEFYSVRSEITKYMISKKGYRIVLLEAEWPYIFLVNKYIHNKSNYSSAREVLSTNVKFAKWMWNNNVIIDLVEWLKKYNLENDDKVYIFGVDCQQFIESHKLLLEFLLKNDKEFYKIIKTQTDILSRFKSEQEYANQIVNGYLKQYSDAIPTLLQGLLASYQWDYVEKYIDQAKQSNLDLVDIISSEQNLEIMVNGEEYFRKMLQEPPGSQASWNTRDQHMLMTIMRMRNRFQYISSDDTIPKIILWAHNSHIGNSNATNRGGKGFEQNNTWNVGQMVKEMFPESYVIGFYTDNGEVFAGKKDNRIGETVELNKANIYSYESYFNELSEEYNIPRFLIELSKFRLNNINRISLEDIAKRPIPAKYRCIDSGNIFTAIERTINNRGVVSLKDTNNNFIVEYIKYANVSVRCIPVDYLIPEDPFLFLNSNLLQRWIGVNYVKETEIDSHYGESIIANQYDSLVYVNTTSKI